MEILPCPRESTRTHIGIAKYPEKDEGKDIKRGLFVGLGVHRRFHGLEEFKGVIVLRISDFPHVENAIVDLRKSKILDTEEGRRILKNDPNVISKKVVQSPVAA